MWLSFLAHPVRWLYLFPNFSEVVSFQCLSSFIDVIIVVVVGVQHTSSNLIKLIKLFHLYRCECHYKGRGWHAPHTACLDVPSYWLRRI